MRNVGEHEEADHERAAATHSDAPAEGHPLCGHRTGKVSQTPQMYTTPDCVLAKSSTTKLKPAKKSFYAPVCIHVTDQSGGRVTVPSARFPKMVSLHLSLWEWLECARAESAEAEGGCKAEEGGESEEVDGGSGSDKS